METGEQGEAAKLEDARGQGEAAWVDRLEGRARLPHRLIYKVS